MRDEREREVAGLMSDQPIDELLSEGRITMDEVIRYQGVNYDFDEEDEDEEDEEDEIKIKNEDYKEFVPFRDDEKTAENGFDLDF
jgi:hypothetical protein